MRRCAVSMLRHLCTFCWGQGLHADSSLHESNGLHIRASQQLDGVVVGQAVDEQQGAEASSDIFRTRLSEKHLQNLLGHLNFYLYGELVHHGQCC